MILTDRYAGTLVCDLGPALYSRSYQFPGGGEGGDTTEVLCPTQGQENQAKYLCFTLGPHCCSPKHKRVNFYWMEVNNRFARTVTTVQSPMCLEALSQNFMRSLQIPSSGPFPGFKYKLDRKLNIVVTAEDSGGQELHVVPDSISTFPLPTSVILMDFNSKT